MSPEEVLRELDVMDWYRRCLEDVQNRRPVRGLDEAKHGYDAAFRRLDAHFSAVAALHWREER